MSRSWRNGLCVKLGVLSVASFAIWCGVVCWKRCLNRFWHFCCCCCGCLNYGRSVGWKSNGVPNSQNQQSAQEQKQAQEEARKNMLHSLIDNEARARLGRIALVDPAKARNIEDRIIILAQQGQVATVTDEQIKQILEGMDTSTHTTVTIRRTKGFDDDSDLDLEEDF
ncbi:uncharacterized protein [Blastocystis hominis]|uniref:Uncharacterized protein n=1 Tax=Blastocystis hominis TaxID=12968 RepID=D8M644_BLAHO|nr:uncharacterized protein [Blastocystis hominis]CBK23753.2 unnamed protein product [Blastocystis hominis]|eukprot:XP_012897801.1 uncharacterized protein [Blastocystis hominis]